MKGNPGSDVQTDLLAFVPPPSLMPTPNGTHYGDKRPHTPNSFRGSSGPISNEMLEQIRMEMEGKDKALAILQTEHQRLRQHLQQVTLSNERSAEVSTAALAHLKKEVQSKSEQVLELREQAMQSKTAQDRLEQQLNSAQQLVRGSLLQHERYETTTEQQATELSQLKREKERLEREVEAMRAEQLEGASNDAAQSLNDVIEQERRRFRKALADERSRSADALERQREEMQLEVQQARERSKREASRAMLEAAVEKGANGETAQALEYQVQVLRNTLERERQTAERSFADLREQMAALQAMAGKGFDESKLVSNSSIVKTWYSPGGSGADTQSHEAKVSRLESALGKVTEERDHWRRKEADVRMQLDQSRAALLEAQVMESDLSETLREKEQAVLELREYEEEVEKLQAQRDNLEDQVKQMASDNDTLSRIIEQQEAQGGAGSQSGVCLKRSDAGGAAASPSHDAEREVEELKSKLKEKEKALVKLQKDYKRLQVIAAGRSAA